MFKSVDFKSCADAHPHQNQVSQIFHNQPALSKTKCRAHHSRQPSGGEFQMRETATARISLGDDGVLVVRVRNGARQGPADARENLAAVLAERAGQKRPLLVDITGSPPLDSETRHLYSGQTLADGFTALALLVEASPFGRMMGNVYFRVAHPGIPIHLFTDEAAAVEWLKGYLR